jgi:hypothetical protein
MIGFRAETAVDQLRAVGGLLAVKAVIFVLVN